MDPLTGAIDPYGMDAIASTISQLEDFGLDSFADNDSVDVGDNLDVLASELFASNRDSGVDLSGPAAAEARFGAPMGESQTGPALPEDRDSVLVLESYDPAPIMAGKGYDTDFGGDFSSYAVTPEQSAYSTSIGESEEDLYDPRGILPISEQVRQAIPITTQAMTDAPAFDPLFLDLPTRQSLSLTLLLATTYHLVSLPTAFLLFCHLVVLPRLHLAFL